MANQKKIKIKEKSLKRQERIKKKTEANMKIIPKIKKRWLSRLLTKIRKKDMTLFNFWKWPLEIIDDINQWFMVRRALKEEETIQALKDFPYGLRKDRIGRLYTVINIPEELYPKDKQEQVWPWMVEQLRALDTILMKRQLSDILYPEVKPIPDAPAYLLILSSSSDSLSILKFLRWLLNLSFIGALLFMIQRITFVLSGNSIIDLIKSFL